MESQKTLGSVVHVNQLLKVVRGKDEHQLLYLQPGSELPNFDQETNGFFLEGELGTLGDQGQGFYPLADNHSFVPCLADTCEVGAEFNLLNMQYQQSGATAQLMLDPDDQRGLLYSQYRDWDGDDTWYRSQSYEVVPIPPAVWLFGSGLLGLIGIARRKKAA